MPRPLSSRSPTDRHPQELPIAAQTSHPATARRRCTLSATLLLASTALLLGCSTTGTGPSASTSAGASAGGGQAITVVDPTDALDLAARPGTTVIDVRTPEEHAAGHLAGAVNIDVSVDTFTDQVSELDTAGSYVVYCRSGARSAAAAAQMADLGFTDIADAGALSDLTDAGGSTVSD